MNQQITVTTVEVLLPCPFCGRVPDASNPATFWMDETTKWGAVECCCVGPEIRTGYEPLEKWRDEAIAEWNKRATPPATGQDATVGSVPSDVRNTITSRLHEDKRRLEALEAEQPTGVRQHELRKINAALAWIDALAQQPR